MRLPHFLFFVPSPTSCFHTIKSISVAGTWWYRWEEAISIARYSSSWYYYLWCVIMSVPSLKLSPIQVTMTRETISRTRSGGRRDICTLITPSDTSRQSLVIFLASPSNNNSLRFFLSYLFYSCAYCMRVLDFCIGLYSSIATKFGAHVSKVGKARRIFSLVSFYNVWSKLSRECHRWVYKLVHVMRAWIWQGQSNA